MATNDLFRMVSLRQSKRSRRENPSASAPDPRLGYVELLDAQSTTTASPHEVTLQKLKGRYAELSKKAAQLETVQVALIDAYMSLTQERPVPSSRPVRSTRATRRGGAARRSSSSLTRIAEAPSRLIDDPRRFIARVETRLPRPEIALFRDIIGTVFDDPPGDLGDIINGLNIGGFRNEANRLCAQIHALEESLGEGLPTVPVEPNASAKPIVAALGWGDLIVARETLVGYQAREIAHIENILPGETKLREHQRLSKTEEVVETETITEKESEKDSQTTDRYELQAETQKTINTDFSVSTAVNVSGQYGVTKVESSLDAAFGRSESESRSSSMNTAREIVNKAVERTFERVRRLRRLTITEEIRELNRHRLSNATASGTPTAISGMYLWVEKIEKIELRHYGTRMMIEFHVPEPALSLHERGAVRNVRKKLPPFNVSPPAIQPENYMCLAQRFGALDVEPPPTVTIEVNWGWDSTLQQGEDKEAGAKGAFTGSINIPAGYRPTWAKVAWSALSGKNEENPRFNFSFALAGKSQNNVEHTVLTQDGVVLQLSGNEWPEGVTVSGRVRGAWDGAMYVHVNLNCVRTTEALDAWRLRTWQALRAGYEVLERKAAQDEQQLALERNLLGAFIKDGPAVENRRIERNELQKWAIKSLRRVPQNFNAIEQIDGSQEVSSTYAEAQAPIVRFYEDAFEWQHMNYFLYPYHWARRASWGMRMAADAVDRQHQAFLEAGAARVIVPVTPGYEDKVTYFLDPKNANLNELKRILGPGPVTVPTTPGDAFHDLWVEVLTDRKPDLARGSGTLKVKKGDVEVHINADSEWSVSEPRDIGRELYIFGNRYEVAAVTDGKTFDLDRPYEGDTEGSALYVAGSTAFGPPWTVNVPTSLIVLADNVPALRNL
jgi:hypothetical protein